MTGAAQDNEAILAELEALGGEYLWEKEIFVVTLLDTQLSDTAAARIPQLVGVQQIALNAERLSFETLQRIARIPRLESLVLRGCSLSQQQIQSLASIGPRVQLIE